MNIDLRVSENELFTFNCSDSGSNPFISEINFTLPDNTVVSVVTSTKSINRRVTQEGMYTCNISNGKIMKSRIYTVSFTIATTGIWSLKDSQYIIKSAWLVNISF